MLLDQFRKSLAGIREIGTEAADKARRLGLEPSWADDDYEHQRRTSSNSGAKGDELPADAIDRPMSVRETRAAGGWNRF